MIDWASKGIDPGRYANHTSGWHKVLCPECSATRKNKREPCLSINCETGVFHCHNCGWKGSAKVFTAEEKEQWMRQNGYWREYKKKKDEQPKKTYSKPPAIKKSTLSPEVIAYFRDRRHISQKTLEFARVTDDMDWMRPNQKKKLRLPNGGETRCIHFNYYRDGELVSAKIRSGDKYFRQYEGCEQIAYNLDNIKDTAECYIVEGEIDALSLIEIGYTNVVSVPDGGNDKGMHWLVDYYEEYFAFKDTVYICSDLDGTGKDLLNELIKHFDPGQYVVIDDYGKDPKTGVPLKDANECLVKLGPNVLREKLANGKSVKPQGDADMERVAEEMDSLFENGLPKGLEMGLSNLDPMLRMQKGRLYILTGTPGSGKSQFLDHIAMLMYTRFGWKFSVFSPEMMPLGQHLSMYMTKLVGKPFIKSEWREEEYQEARQAVVDAIHFIEPEENEIDTILSIAKYQVRKYGCDSVIIDPWNSLLMGSQSVFKPETINEALLKILTFAQRQDICVFCMPHPINQQTNKDGKPIKMHLYNISGGAMFRNRADFGMVMTRHYKDDPDNPHGFDYVELAIEKTKWEHVGELGTVYFRYQKGVGRFHPFDPVTGETQWDEHNYLRAGHVVQTEMTLEPEKPSEANVQGFIDQAARADREQNRPTSLEDNDDLPFDNNEETPF